LSTGSYYHLTAVYDPGVSMKFYVNGALNGENTSVSSPLLDIGDTLNIGGSSTNYSCYVKIPVAKGKSPVPSTKGYIKIFFESSNKQILLVN
jgi:hypothetical protein